MIGQQLLESLRVQLSNRTPYEGLRIGSAGAKGLGIFATRPFHKEEYLCEFEGRRSVFKKENFMEDVYFFNFQVGKRFYRSAAAYIIFISKSNKI